MTETTRWWWVRHAPVTAYAGRVYGQTDLPCDTSDAAAFQGLAGHLPDAAVLVTSNLRRTHETAAAIVEAGLALGEPTIEPDLAEQHLGDWQGQPRAEVYGSLGVSHPFWILPAETAPPGGESFNALSARVCPAILRLSEAHAGRHIVAVTHGGTIRAALGLALGLSPDAALAFSVDNLSVTRLDHVGATPTSPWRVVMVNRRPV